MPFTPYHAGPSGLIALLFRRWLDIPVFLLVNVAVDIEVLVMMAIGTGWRIHMYGHTFLGGAAAGILTALVLYPVRHKLGRIMGFLKLPYRKSFRRMAVSGILGAWLHAILDAPYNWDVFIFWPSRARPLIRLAERAEIVMLCEICLLLAAVVYAIILFRTAKT